MEVTRCNFADVLPIVRKAIEECHFIAIDTEFTGLTASETLEYSLLDSVDRRYDKTRHSVQQFTLCEIGLTTFTGAPLSHDYKASAFNFYVFPRDFEMVDVRFGVQASSLAFLCEHHFDFNKFVYDGISYLDSEQEDFLRKQHANDKEEEKAKFETELDEAIGFTHIFKLLVEAQKPMVGHNMFMDLLFFYDKFYKPLPAKYSEFKHDIHQLFPFLIDTKHVVNEIRQKLKPTKKDQLLRSTVLEELHPAMTGENYKKVGLWPPQVKLEEGYERYEKDQFHEAGYDAYATGVVLLRACHLLARLSMDQLDSNPTSWAKVLLLVTDWMNRVNMIRCSIFSLNLAGPDAPSTRPMWLSFTKKDFFGAITVEEVQAALEKYGSLDVEKDGFKCIVATAGKESARNILEGFENDAVFCVREYQWSGVYMALAAGLTGATLVAAYYMHRTGRLDISWLPGVTSLDISWLPGVTSR